MKKVMYDICVNAEVSSRQHSFLTNYFDLSHFKSLLSSWYNATWMGVKLRGDFIAAPVSATVMQYVDLIFGIADEFRE